MTKILAIDDKKDNLISLSAILKSLIPGCTVITALSGLEGIEKAKDESPDTILLDIKMPGMDGYEVCKRLKENNDTKDIPVIMISAILTQSGDLIKGLDTGADAYLTKPIDEHVLIAQVKTALRMKKAEDTLRSKKDVSEKMVQDRTAELINSNKLFKREIKVRRQTEKELKEAIARHSAMIENIGDVIGIIGADGIMKYISPNIEKCFGWKPEDLIGTKSWERVHPDGIERIKKEFYAGIEKENASVTVEYRYKCKDGTYTWIELTAVNRINDNIINGVLLNYHDISERKQAEEEKKKNGRRFRILTEATFEGVVFHEKGVIFDFNDQFAEMFRYKREELIGMRVVDLASPDTRELVKHNALTNLEKPYEAGGLRKDGSIFMGELLGKAFPYEGRIVRVTSVRDITARKRAEEALTKSEERFRIIFEQSSYGIALIDSLTGHIYEVNPKFAQIAGRTLEEMLSIDWMSITHPDDVQEDLDNMTLLNAGKINGFNMEKRYILPDGSFVWIDMKITPLKAENETQPCHLCMIQDITAGKKAEEALKSSEERLRTIFNAAKNVSLIITDAQDPEPKVMEFSPGAERMFGYSSKEVRKCT